MLGFVLYYPQWLKCLYLSSFKKSMYDDSWMAEFKNNLQIKIKVL